MMTLAREMGSFREYMLWFGGTDGGPRVRSGPDKVGKQASAACRHRPQFVVLLIVNFVGTDPIKDICL